MVHVGLELVGSGTRSLFHIATPSLGVPGIFSALDEDLHWGKGIQHPKPFYVGLSLRGN